MRTPEISDFPTDVSFSGRSITLPGRPDANVLVTVWKWRDPESAWADLFVAPELVGDAEYVSDQIAIAAGQASSMGANVLNVVIPEPLSAAIQRRFDATVVPLERGDPWLVKSLGDSL